MSAVMDLLLLGNYFFKHCFTGLFIVRKCDGSLCQENRLWLYFITTFLNNSPRTGTLCQVLYVLAYFAFCNKIVSKYSATLGKRVSMPGWVLISFIFCATAAAESKSRASDWFADEGASTEIVQIGARQATRDAYYQLAGLATITAVGIAFLLLRQRRRERVMLAQLSQTEERLREAQAIASIGSWTRDFATGEMYWSPEARALLMLGDEQKQWGHYETFVHPDDLPLVIETIARAYCRGGIYHCDHRLVCPNGVVKYVRLVGRIYLSGKGALNEKGGGAVFEHGTVQDITERKMIELHLRENEEKLRVILNASPVAMLIVNLTDSFIVRYANAATYQLFGLYADSDLSSLTVSKYWLSQESFEQFKFSVFANDSNVQSEALLRKNNGALFWAGLQASLMEYGSDKALLICVQDISAQRAHLDELEKRATLDPLTGVLNSHSMRDVAKKEFRRATRYNQPLSMCLISLDQLRAVGEGFGHVAAEQLLKQFVDMLKDGVRVEDSIGRLNQEEFVLLLIGATAEGARLVAERIRIMCEEEYFELHRQRIRLTVSAGLSTLETANENVEEVMQRAMEGLQQARRMGANCVSTRMRLNSEHQKKA